MVSTKWKSNLVNMLFESEVVQLGLFLAQQNVVLNINKAGGKMSRLQDSIIIIRIFFSLELSNLVYSIQRIGNQVSKNTAALGKPFSFNLYMTYSMYAFEYVIFL